MKVDCGYTENYLKELKRMCEENFNCLECGFYISNKNKGEEFSCRGFQKNRPDEAVKLVQKWSDEHQVETRKEHFLKMFPNASIWKGRPFLCVRNLSKKVSCENDCKKCWDKPYTEGEF